MAVEQQTQYDTTGVMYVGQYYKQGQKLTIPDREVTKLGFWLSKQGLPTGDVIFRIEKTDETPIASKVLCGAGALTTEAVYYEVTFDTSHIINEEVRIYAEFNNGDSSNYVFIHFQNSDVKADEMRCAYKTSWVDISGGDMAYIYTYGAEVSVTIQPMTDILLPTAKAHGTIILGETPCTQHGHCWATSPNPTIADNKTELGAGAEGTFESTLTGLLPSTTYYVRAYATDGAGTFYSAEISFIRYGPWRDEAELPFTPTGQIFLSPIIGDEVYVIDQGTNFYKYNLTTRVWTELTSPNYGSDVPTHPFILTERFFRTLAISPDGTKLACCSEGKWSTYSNSQSYQTGGGRRVEIYNIAENNWSASKQTDFLFAGVWTATRSLVWEDDDTLWVWCIRHQRTATGWQIQCVKYVISLDEWTAYTSSFQDKATGDNGINCGWSAAIKADKSVVYGGGTGSPGYGYRYTKYNIEGDDYTHLPLDPLTNRFVHAYDRDKIWYYEAGGTCQQGYVNVEDDSLHDDQFPENPDRTAGYGKYCGISDDLRNIIAHARISEGSGTELMSYTAIVAPTVSTDAVTEIEEETATGNGNITDKGGENCDHRGIVYGKTSKGDPGNTAPGSSGYDDYEDESGSFDTGAFTRSLTALDSGTKYYVRAYAHNSAGYSYGNEVSFTALAKVKGNPDIDQRMFQHVERMGR